MGNRFKEYSPVSGFVGTQRIRDDREFGDVDNAEEAGKAAAEKSMSIAFEEAKRRQRPEARR